MPWFVKIEEGIVDKQTFDQYVPAHVAFVKDLITQGHHAKTGHWSQQGGGMLLFQADSMDHAKLIISQDPLVLNHCVNYKLYEWCIVVQEEAELQKSSQNAEDPESTPAPSIPYCCYLPVLTKFGRRSCMGPSQPLQ